ncbi:hypothetical protein FF80_03313 [Devosia sp. LC5]|nr:hypothetical protein FF80_03313 [Devosia sp. LC5]
MRNLLFNLYHSTLKLGELVINFVMVGTHSSNGREEFIAFRSSRCCCTMWGRDVGATFLSGSYPLLKSEKRICYCLFRRFAI